tara:strand:+ start:155 stop:385 length:231 start_codon:yes stop_codon:yes gene_type:complete
MATDLEMLREQIAALDKAPILAQAAAAKAAINTAVKVIAAQANDIAVIRARLDNVESRAAMALRACQQKGGLNDGA